jgi:NAD-dependent DNA ligase
MEYTLRSNPNAREFAAVSLSQSRDAYRELLAICEGLLADHEVNSTEADYLKQWLERHSQHRGAWPFSDLIARLNLIFADGVASPDECHELAGILKALMGARVVHCDSRLAGSGMSGPTELIFDDPAPDVIFSEREFCITGTFAFGQRSAVDQAIRSRGGATVKRPSSNTHYVLVGSFVSLGWANGNFGTKIERAMSLRKGGAAITIIGEEHWKKFVE